MLFSQPIHGGMMIFVIIPKSFQGSINIVVFSCCSTTFTTAIENSFHQVGIIAFQMQGKLGSTAQLYKAQCVINGTRKAIEQNPHARMSSHSPTKQRDNDGTGYQFTACHDAGTFSSQGCIAGNLITE
jgi:hypothetical protein